MDPSDSCSPLTIRIFELATFLLLLNLFFLMKLLLNILSNILKAKD